MGNCPHWVLSTCYRGNSLELKSKQQLLYRKRGSKPQTCLEVSCDRAGYFQCSWCASICNLKRWTMYLLTCCNRGYIARRLCEMRLKVSIETISTTLSLIYRIIVFLEKFIRVFIMRTCRIENIVLLIRFCQTWCKSHKMNALALHFKSIELYMIFVICRLRGLNENKIIIIIIKFRCALEQTYNKLCTRIKLIVHNKNKTHSKRLVNFNGINFQISSLEKHFSRSAEIDSLSLRCSSHTNQARARAKQRRRREKKRRHRGRLCRGKTKQNTLYRGGNKEKRRGSGREKITAPPDTRESEREKFGIHRGALR